MRHRFGPIVISTKRTFPLDPIPDQAQRAAVPYMKGWVDGYMTAGGDRDELNEAASARCEALERELSGAPLGQEGERTA